MPHRPGQDDDPFEFDDAAADPSSTDLDDTIADVELDEQLDAIEEPKAAEQPGTPAAAAAAPVDPMDDYDPEAGYSNIAKKSTVAGQLTSDAGMFIIGCILALVGVGAVIMAAIMQTRPYVIAAAIIAPPTFIWCFFRWKRWLGQVPYLVRLLHSLDEKEDAKALLERHQTKQQRKLEQRLQKIEAKQDKIIAKHRGIDPDDGPIELK